jgi:hypothetical protein
VEGRLLKGRDFYELMQRSLHEKAPARVADGDGDNARELDLRGAVGFDFDVVVHR